MTFTETVKRRWPWIVAIVVVAASIGLLIAAMLGAFSAPAPVTEAPKPTITAEPESTPTPEPTEEPLPAPTIDIPEVKPMPYSEVWTPPDEGESFWKVIDPAYGYPEAGGTEFVLAHACETRECAGDEVRRLEVGDTLTYLGQEYQVQDSREIMKVDIANQDIWVHDPNRLVIITCIIETTAEASDKNDIIIATKV